MSSVWSSSASPSSLSPFATNDLAPSPGNSAATKFQSLQQAAAGKLPTPGQPPSTGIASATSTSETASTSSTSGTSSSTGTSTTISANDFLSLLVTEMQNQDPTSQTDPNQYINQLVQINSLEQLISINQNLTTVLGAGTPTTNPSGSAGAGVSASDATQSAVAPSRPSVTSVRSITELANQTANASVDSNATRGNLSTPTASPAAASVGHSLDGKVHGPASAHFIRDLPTRALP